MRFEGCSFADLEVVAAALTGNRLRFPISEIAIDRLNLANSAVFFRELAALDGAGWSAQQVAELIRSISLERRSAANAGPRIEVVITGPDALGAYRDTAVVVEQLFSEAQISVLVVGYALFDGPSILRRLAAQMDAIPTLDVKLCLDISRHGNDTTRDDDLVMRFAQRFVEREWPGSRLPSVYFDPRGLGLNSAGRAVLHAKCVVVDRKAALVTSANLTPAAQSRNIELGLIVRNSAVSAQVQDHFESLIAKGHLKRLSLET